VTGQDVRTVLAPAKLTLSLRVTGVREDGYHLLDSEMVSIDLADEIEIAGTPEIPEIPEIPEMTGMTGITLVDEVVGGTGIREIPSGEKNLVARALRLVGRSASIRLVKRIPAGAGLGGGSADAAAVLRWACRPEVDLALQLGADVPFCLRGGRARVRGVGELVEPLEYEERRYVLLLPPLSVSTATVYRIWDERQRREERDRPDDLLTDHVNDLEASALEAAPELGRWRNCFHEATLLRPRLAGSGSAWFVEGDLASIGLENRSFLVLGGERAALVPVRTLRPETMNRAEGPLGSR